MLVFQHQPNGPSFYFLGISMFLQGSILSSYATSENHGTVQSANGRVEWKTREGKILKEFQEERER